MLKKGKAKRQKNADAVQQQQAAATQCLPDRVYANRSDIDNNIKTEGVNTGGWII
jgi:hypothetical protein